MLLVGCATGCANDGSLPGFTAASSMVLLELLLELASEVGAKVELTTEAGLLIDTGLAVVVGCSDELVALAAPLDGRKLSGT